MEDFCCPVPKLNRLFMVGSCFTGHAIQLFWHMSTCYQIILRIFFHKISQNILVIQEFQIILVCSSYLWPWMTIWKCAFFLFLLPNNACIFCSFRWIDHWLKTTYETLNVSWSFFLWFFFQKEKRPGSAVLLSFLIVARDIFIDAPNNSNESYAFIGLGRRGRFGQS